MNSFVKKILYGSSVTAVVGSCGGVYALYTAAHGTTAAAHAAAGSGWIGTFASGAGSAISTVAGAIGSFAASAPGAIGHFLLSAGGWVHGIGHASMLVNFIGAGAAGAIGTVAAIAVPVVIAGAALMLAKKAWNHFHKKDGGHGAQNALAQDHTQSQGHGQEQGHTQGHGHVQGHTPDVGYAPPYPGNIPDARPNSRILVGAGAGGRQ